MGGGMSPARNGDPGWFLYVRVSTCDQAEYGTSLDGQRDLGTKFCAEQGYADPQVRVEVESAALGH
jgi:DNA invertase Pin-like site-specific DNA recombinase